MTVKQNGVTFVDDVGPGGGADVNIVSVSGSAITKGQKTMAESFPVVLPSDQSEIPVVARQGAASATPWSVINKGLIAGGVLSAPNTFIGLSPQNGAGVCSVYVTDTGSFLGTLIAVGGPSSTFDRINRIYNAEDDIVVTEIPLDKLCMFPCGGLEFVAVYVLAHTSGSCDVEIGAGPGTLSMPKKANLAPASPAVAVVGVASALAVAANGLRKGLILINISANRISLGFGVAAVLDSGITLYPQGSYNMAEFDFSLAAINAIASGAGSNLAIQEYS